jgi:hypothetical protein
VYNWQIDPDGRNVMVLKLQIHAKQMGVSLMLVHCWQMLQLALQRKDLNGIIASIPGTGCCRIWHMCQTCLKSAEMADQNQQGVSWQHAMSASISKK